MILTKVALSLLVAMAQAWTLDSRELIPEDGSSLTERWLPKASKVRGVNLGSQFIIEEWFTKDSWKNMGCYGWYDEWNCVKALGQAKADEVWKNHWNTWITEADIKQIKEIGLNTVRIPVGFWMRESLVYANEYYPRGGLPYLDRIVGWCKKYGVYAIIDLHGAPGSQSPNEEFTGHIHYQGVNPPQFYTSANYERALKFLEWMTNRIHTNGNYTTVGMLQVLNEPVRGGVNATDMRKNFYPKAYERIQAAEAKLNVAKADRLHIQFMKPQGTSWGSGDPREFLPSTEMAFFDAHRYLSFDNRIEGTKKAYITQACKDNMGTNVTVGEWSLSVNSTLKNTPEFKYQGQETWYRAYWAAQAESFERSNGWIFWTWKCDGVEDWRWCYKKAVEAGVIPKDAGSAAALSPCSRYT
ncbi:unnamed protein product [Clonostachys rosea f. rosea IK726]|uniref:glucan 1,3-beta-glucosidase n=2 Tax=Bionectria ochroleuca TaxID=29856 RepID=A0A0B7KEQ5_BIOOC|nr:unnamed protein product [Clonostachys rosea f. rosea IK726]